MSFFKKILSDVVGDGVADALTSNVSKNIAKRAATGALNAAAEKATENAVGSAINKAFGAFGRRSSLDTPAAPPVPEMGKSLSVMIAVNGESYGPYERAGLLKMIADGSLTKKTFVFIKGMDNWTPAGDVPEVAELFAMHAPAPAVPPVPWSGQSSSKNEDSGASDNNLSPRLNKLITAAVADGEISDLERQVLIRNAQEEGVAMDEFVMVLEARLYEQRRVLQDQEDAKKRAEREMTMKAAATAKAPTSQRPKDLTKCPHCGAPIKPLATACPECGYDYPSNVSSSTGWSRLAEILDEIDRTPVIRDKGFFGWLDSDDVIKSRQKAEAIEKFPVPTDKQGLVDFFVNCAPLSKNSYFSDEYKTKAKQVLIKARIVLKDDPKLLEEINAIAKQYKIKA